MGDQHIKYPKNWIEAKILVKNLEEKFISIKQLSPKGHQRSKELLSLIKISYAILESLDIAISNSRNSKEITRLMTAKKVLCLWMWNHNLIGENNER